MVKGRHRTQALCHLGQHVQNVINILLRRFIAQGEPHGSVRNLVRETKRKQNMRRVKRAGCTGRSARGCGFKTFGCGAAIATSSMATEMIKGKSIDEALKLSNAAVVEALEGLPPQKIHCSVLAEEAVKSAIEDYYKRKNGEAPETEKTAE